MMTPRQYFDIIPKYVDMNIRTELTHINEFTFAVAVILSAQATDKKVNEITPALFAIAPTPVHMMVLGVDDLKKYIHQISFFNNKAKSIIGLAAALMNDAGADDVNYQFPTKYHNRDALMKLPGIGQKTANVIMNVLWGAPNIGVDTHVFRNAHRYGWVNAAANTPERVEEQLLRVIPKKYHNIVNHVMVLHGRYTCRALRPKCGQCPVANICTARDKTI
ncbi:MAG: endonuclease III [Alphaproteobacteria bacterium]|nr:endonuclease III [Alphaproteobacteria bacterium]